MRATSSSRVLITVVGVASLGAMAGTVALHAAPMTARVSVDLSGGDANDISYQSSVSGNGRYVAFVSDASDLVTGDTNGAADVFRRDLLEGTTVRVSVDSGGGNTNGGSYEPSISPNGRYVAFASDASDVVPGDGNRSRDVFVRDVVGGTTAVASVDTTGGPPNGDSDEPSISPDGRHVAFASEASDLAVGDGNGVADIFVYDLVAGTTVRASVAAGGGDPNDKSQHASLSANGASVAFVGFGSNLVADDANGEPDIFVRDLVLGTTERASVDVLGGDSNDESFWPSINRDGRFVAFESWASDLVPGDGNRLIDIFVRDLTSAVTKRASVDTGGGDPDEESHHPSLSGSGRFVAFQSKAADLIVGDGNGIYDIFVRDTVGELTVRASVDTEGGDPDALSTLPALSGDGRVVAFQSIAPDLVPGDSNVATDVFARRLV